MPALTVTGLGVRRGAQQVLAAIDLEIRAGEAVAVVGSSGAGKSTLVRALLGLLTPSPELVVTGEVSVAGIDVDLGRPDHDAWAKLRGRILGWLPQSSTPSLDPVRTVAAQLRELSSRAPEDWLASMGLSSELLDRYPRELSGGQATRVALALALAPGPSFLFADEPWTALDGPTSRALIDQLTTLRSRGTGLFIVTHDLARLCVTALVDRVVVLEDGQFVEENSPTALVRAPKSVAGRALAHAARRDLGLRDGLPA